MEEGTGWCDEEKRCFPPFSLFLSGAEDQPEAGSEREKRSSAHEDTFTAVCSKAIIIYLLTQHCFLAELVIVYFEAS